MVREDESVKVGPSLHKATGRVGNLLTHKGSTVISPVSFFISNQRINPRVFIPNTAISNTTTKKHSGLQEL